MRLNEDISYPGEGGLRGVAAEFGRFFGAGLVSTAAHYSLLFFLVRYAAAGVILSSTLGACLGAFVNYCLNYFYTFKSSRRHTKAAVVFVSVAAAGFAINAAALEVAINRIGLHVVLAQAGATGLVFTWNYFAHRKWTF